MSDKYIYIKFRVNDMNGEWRRKYALYAEANGLTPVQIGICEADSEMVDPDKEEAE